MTIEVMRLLYNSTLPRKSWQRTVGRSVILGAVQKMKYSMDWMDVQ